VVIRRLEKNIDDESPTLVSKGWTFCGAAPEAMAEK
jgi:hypothetical protein